MSQSFRVPLNDYLEEATNASLGLSNDSSGLPGGNYALELQGEAPR